MTTVPGPNSRTDARFCCIQNLEVREGTKAGCTGGRHSQTTLRQRSICGSLRDGGRCTAFLTNDRELPTVGILQLASLYSIVRFRFPRPAVNEFSLLCCARSSDTTFASGCGISKAKPSSSSNSSTSINENLRHRVGDRPLVPSDYVQLTFVPSFASR